MWRKAHASMWRDRKVRGLSQGALVVWWYLWSSDKTLPVGAGSYTREGIAGDLSHWQSSRGTKSAITELEKGRMIECDWDAGMVMIPNFLEYQPPSNPNQIKGWQNRGGRGFCVLDRLPECELLYKLCSNVCHWCDDRGWGDSLHERFRVLADLYDPTSLEPSEPKDEGANSASDEKKKAKRREIKWRVDEVWKTHVTARKNFFKEKTGRVPPEPKLTAEIRGYIRESIKRNDKNLGADERNEWIGRSPTRAAGIGIFYDRWMTASHPDNHRDRGGKTYLEPWRPWKVQRGKADPVPGFAQQYWDERDQIPC